MTITTKQTQVTRWEAFTERVGKVFGWLFTVRKVGAFLLLIALVNGVVGYRLLHGAFDWRVALEDFYANISAELFSIAMTVLIVDSLYQRRQKAAERDRLVRQMRSSDHGIALSAVEELRAVGALKDGTLHRVNLEEANLENARLGRASLREARMDFSILSNAQLYFANLERADMSSVNLERSTLTCANMRHVDLVAADLRGALMNDADLTGAKLHNAQFDARTVLPDGTQWSSEEKLLERFTDPKHPRYWRSAWKESPAYDRRVARTRPRDDSSRPPTPPAADAD